MRYILSLSGQTGASSAAPYASDVVTCPNCGRQNPAGARFCNACASPLPADERPVGEERKDGHRRLRRPRRLHSALGALDPEDVRGLLAPYHARVRAEFERFGGTVEKFIGDAVVAVFGAPVAHEDDPERALRAALAIRDWAAEEPDLQLRIAVTPARRSSTSCATGRRRGDGRRRRRQHGGAAAEAAPVNGVLVGETTYRATRDAIDPRTPTVDAKGKADAGSSLGGRRPFARTGIDVERGARTPLVGRERELELLASIFARVRDERSAQLVTLVGVPGIGKSRLVAELLAIVDRAPGLTRWRQGRCLPYGESVTFWALGEIVKAEAGILENDSPEDVERKLRAAVTNLVPDESESRWLEGELRALAGAAASGETSASTTGWRRFLEAVAEQGPTVLVFEDLHWADDGLLDFVDDLVDWLRDVPLLLVGTARPELLERRQSWGGGKPNTTTISLQPLAEVETARLISALLEQPVQLADEQRSLLERAGGNPLFAEQFVRMVSEGGDRRELPESVQGVIAARLDALPRREKELLQEAAVHGKVFWVGGLVAALGLDRGEAEDVLRTLDRKDFVRRERRSAVAGDTQYSFQHVLLRDVAYGQIPRRSRSEKHLHAARWLEGLGRPEDHAELLAHHYARALELARAAGDPDDPAVVAGAREAFRAAGQRALALSAYAAADTFFADALGFTEQSDPARPAMLLERARALFPLGRPGFDLFGRVARRVPGAGERRRRRSGSDNRGTIRLVRRRPRGHRPVHRAGARGGLRPADVTCTRRGALAPERLPDAGRELRGVDSRRRGGATAGRGTRDGRAARAPPHRCRHVAGRSR